jgi:predicted transcriptional regulator
VTIRNRREHALTELQQAILAIVHERGRATADEVRQALAPRHRLKDSSVRTLLRRLEARDYLTHTSEGKVFHYAARIRPRSVAARAVRHIIERFWAGSAEQFLLGMVDENVLSRREIERLAKKVKQK